MKYLIDENFKDFPLNELPYDKFHTALGEYHHIEYDGYFGGYEVAYYIGGKRVRQFDAWIHAEKVVGKHLKRADWDW